MAVTINYALDHPEATNKPGYNYKDKHAVNCKDVCYSYSRGENSKVYVMKPVIDFLTITVPVKDKDTQEAIKYYLAQNTKHHPEIWKYVNKSDLPEATYCSYKRNYKMTIGDGLLGVQIIPGVENHKFMRLILQPSRLSASELKAYIAELTGISGIGVVTWDYIANEGEVTRADWAIDFMNLDAGDMVFDKIGSRRKSQAYLGPKGGIETVYVMNSNAKGPHKAYTQEKRSQSDAASDLQSTASAPSNVIRIFNSELLPLAPPPTRTKNAGILRRLSNA